MEIFASVLFSPFRRWRFLLSVVRRNNIIMSGRIGERSRFERAKINPVPRSIYSKVQKLLGFERKLSLLNKMLMLCGGTCKF